MASTSPTIAQEPSGTEEPEDEDKLIAEGWMKFSNGRWGRIIDVLISQRKVDLQGSVGMGVELAAAIDRNYGDLRWLDPQSGYNPGFLRHHGDDLADNARGIYYADDLRAGDKSKVLLGTDDDIGYVERRVLRYRKNFIPSFDGIDWNESRQKSRRKRAVTASSNALLNGMWKRSEFAWDADARNDIFSPFRQDCRLDMDKHEYSALLRETHPTRCTLTGNRRLVKRIPDETFALRTHGRGDFVDPSLDAGVFCQDRLQRLLLHPKCGLISDPKWGQSKMVFPFGIYEAKGWAGNYKEAKRQACAGAHRFLNMLDLLARVPGTSVESKRYQTERSRFPGFRVHFLWRTLACSCWHQASSLARTACWCRGYEYRCHALQEDLERLHRDATRRMGTASTRRSDPQMGNNHISRLCDTTPKGVA